MEIGKQISWEQAIGQVFRVLDFDRAGTRVLPGDKVKAGSLFKPYGYLLVESPIFAGRARLPIVHKTDFILATTVYDEPQLVQSLENAELLVTYVPKQRLPGGMAGTTHALHYAISPPNTLSKYYQVRDGIHRSNPEPWRVVGNLVWDGLVKVNIISEPDI